MTETRGKLGLDGSLGQLVGRPNGGVLSAICCEIRWRGLASSSDRPNRKGFSVEMRTGVHRSDALTRGGE